MHGPFTALRQHQLAQFLVQRVEVEPVRVPAADLLPHELVIDVPRVLGNADDPVVLPDSAVVLEWTGALAGEAHRRRERRVRY